MQETYTIVCPKCKSQFNANHADIPAEGRDVRCSNCFEVWRFKPDNNFDEHGSSQQDTPKHENFFESASVQKLEEDARKAQETADLNRTANAQQEPANQEAKTVESPTESPVKSVEEITTANAETSTSNQSDIDDIFNDSANTEQSVDLSNEDRSPSQDETNKQEKADADSIFDRMAKVSKELAQKAPQAGIAANASSSDDINQSLENIRKNIIKESSSQAQEVAPEEAATDIKSIFDKVAEANKKLTETGQHSKTATSSEESTSSTPETTLDPATSPETSTSDQSAVDDIFAGVTGTDINEGITEEASPAEASPETSTSDQSAVDDIFAGVTGTDINEDIAEEASPEASPETSTSDQSAVDDIFAGVTGTDINEAIAEEASPAEASPTTEGAETSPTESTSDQSAVDDIFAGVTGTDINEDITEEASPAEASPTEGAEASPTESAEASTSDQSAVDDIFAGVTGTDINEDIAESKEPDQKESDQEDAPKQSEASAEEIDSETDSENETLESKESNNPDKTEEQKGNDNEGYDLISPGDGPLASSEKNENHLLEALNKANIAVTEDIGDPIPHRLTTDSKAGDDLSFIHDAPPEDETKEEETEEKVDQDKLAEDWEKSLGLTPEDETTEDETKEEETEEEVDQDKLAEDWEKSLEASPEEEAKEEESEEKVDQDKLAEDWEKSLEASLEEKAEVKEETEQLDDKPFKPIETAKPKRKRGFFGGKKTLVSSTDVVDIESSQEQVLDRKPSDDLYPDEAKIDPAPSELNPLQEESLASVTAKTASPEATLKDIPGADTFEKDTPQQEQPAPPKRRVPSFQVDYGDKEHLSQRKAAIMSFFCLAVLLLGVYALITQAKDSIVKIIPETGILYQISGQEIPPFESSFLEILQPSVITSIDKKLQYNVQVRGIVNNSNSTLTQKIPFIVAEVFNQSGDLINNWQIELPEKELLAGSSVTFLDKERPISENSNYIKLKLYYKEWTSTNNVVFANNENQ